MADEYNMEVGSFLRFGMENAKRHWLKFFGIQLLGLFGLGVLGVVGFQINPNLGFTLLIVGAIGFSFGFFANVVRLASGEGFEIKEFIPNPMVFLNFMVGMILYVLAVAVGLVLLIVPGVIVALMFGLVPFCIIHQKMNFLDAFAQSARLTRGHKMDIFVGNLVANLVISLLSIPVITLFFTIPMQVFVQVYPYVQLSGEAKSPSELPEGSLQPAAV